MEGIEDEDYHFDSVSEPPEVSPPQDAEATDPLGPYAGEFGRDSLSPAKPIEHDNGGKGKKPGAGKVARSWERPIWRFCMALSATSTFPMRRN